MANGIRRSELDLTKQGQLTIDVALTIEVRSLTFWADEHSTIENHGTLTSGQLTISRPPTVG
ncbi:MAG: hypothetical protein R3C05_05280 [Pirellulaceae bacterium]